MTTRRESPDAIDFDGIYDAVEMWNILSDDEKGRWDYHPDEWSTIQDAVTTILEDHPSEWIYTLEEMQEWGGSFGDLMRTFVKI